MLESLERFLKMLHGIDDPDYGDFMRRANLYFLQLKIELAPTGTEIRRRLDRIQVYLIDFPNWDIESTMSRLDKDCGEIRELLQGQKQDWESEGSELLPPRGQSQQAVGALVSAIPREDRSPLCSMPSFRR